MTYHNVSSDFMSRLCFLYLSFRFTQGCIPTWDSHGVVGRDGRGYAMAGASVGIYCKLFGGVYSRETWQQQFNNYDNIFGICLPALT